MLALITARCWEEDNKGGHWHEYYTVKDDCDSFEEAGRFVDAIFGSEADTIKVEFVDVSTIYVNKEILQGLSTDKYFDECYSKCIDPKEPM